MDELFHEIDGAAAILRDRRGVFRQAKVFRRGDFLFAGFGSGFIRLYKNNGTSTPTVFLDALVGVNAEADTMGRLVIHG